eukprot:g2184.t1
MVTFMAETNKDAITKIDDVSKDSIVLNKKEKMIDAKAKVKKKRMSVKKKHDRISGKKKGNQEDEPNISVVETVVKQLEESGSDTQGNDGSEMEFSDDSDVIESDEHDNRDQGDAKDHQHENSSSESEVEMVDNPAIVNEAGQLSSDSNGSSNQGIKQILSSLSKLSESGDLLREQKFIDDLLEMMESVEKVKGSKVECQEKIEELVRNFVRPNAVQLSASDVALSDYVQGVGLGLLRMHHEEDNTTAASLGGSTINRRFMKRSSRHHLGNTTKTSNNPTISRNNSIGGTVYDDEKRRQRFSLLRKRTGNESDGKKTSTLESLGDVMETVNENGPNGDQKESKGSKEYFVTERKGVVDDRERRRSREIMMKTSSGLPSKNRARSGSSMAIWKSMKSF